MFEVSKRKEAKSMVQIAFRKTLKKNNRGQNGCICLKSPCLFFWLRQAFIALCRFSGCGGQGLPIIAAHGLLVAVLHENTSSRCRARALGTQVSVVAARGLTSCGSQALECRLHRSWHVGSAALEPVESSRTRE